ncbi:hypothetical protein H3K64_003215 [Escherichia coli]|nr:hypothetical protein [Escherichia coli]
MTRFSGASSAMHTNDRSLTMVDLFCCAGATARLVSEAGSEELRITVKEIGEYPPVSA